MTRYHMNGQGEPGRCTARPGHCPFGADAPHFDSPGEARATYEGTQATFATSGFKKATFTDEDVAFRRSEAVFLAGQMDADPAWLPPVDDPAKPDGIGEDEGYVDSLEAFRDPALSMGNCVTVAEAIQGFTEGEYGYIQREAGGPHLNIHAANLYTDAKGREWVVDYTYSQVDPQAAWPHVAPRAEWEAAVDAAGHDSPAEIKAAHELSKNDHLTAYQDGHRPDEDGALASEVDAMYPDFYDRPRLYHHGTAAYDESITALMKIRGNPEAEVTIYRALQNEAWGINEGDWVTLSPSYAQTHAAMPDAADDWPVVAMKVKVKDLRTPGDDINEWGYFPSV